MKGHWLTSRLDGCCTSESSLSLATFGQETSSPNYNYKKATTGLASSNFAVVIRLKYVSFNKNSLATSTSQFDQETHMGFMSSILSYHKIKPPNYWMTEF